MLNFGVTEAGLGLNTYRFRGRNFNRAKRGDFKQSTELIFALNFWSKRVINSWRARGREIFFEARRTFTLLQVVIQSFINEKKIFHYGGVCKKSVIFVIYI